MKSLQVPLPLPAAAWLYQSQPLIRRPVNSGWEKSTPVSMLPMTTAAPPAPTFAMASSSASLVEAYEPGRGPVRPFGSL